MAFHTTRWSLIARAHRDNADTAASTATALDELCRIYWPAVYAMYRGEGLSGEAARDMTQGLFLSLLERHDFERADPHKGRFRAFLRTCARNWLANQRDRERAQKRGGGRLHEHGTNQAALRSLDADAKTEAEEQRYLAAESRRHLNPEAQFERRWAEAVIEHALQQLEQREQAAGRGDLFALLRPLLEGEAPEGSWAAMAERLGSTEGALRVAAHRLRQRFRERLEAQVRDTLGEELESGAELSELLAALSQ